jgi:transposase-like protein
MPCILPNFLSLFQYTFAINNTSEDNRPERCPYCGVSGLWCHGPYERKADRENSSDASLNPVLIQRYLCLTCRRTCSVLPECIPPRRWYLWEIQQKVLLLYLLGQSAYAIAKESSPSYKTIVRWFLRFNAQFRLHKDTLTIHFNALGQTSGIAEFWQVCFKKITLGSAMRLCHVAGVFIP